MKNILFLLAIFSSLAFGQTNKYNILDTTILSGTAAVTSGTISNTTVGIPTPALGAFTTLSASGTLQVGSGSTTNAGLIAGYSGVSGGGSIWSSAVIPSTTNHALQAASTVTGLNATGTVYLTVSGSDKLNATSSLTTSSNPVSVTNTTDSTSTTTGSLKTAGGLGVAKKSFFGDSINVAAPGTITVGTGSGTSAGLIAGYLGSSGYGGIWSTGVTPNSSNYAISFDATHTYLSGTSIVGLAYAGAVKLQVTSTGTAVVGDMFYDKTITAPATTGAQTINKTTGRVNFAAAATSLVVTNSLATANSICHVTKATNDATMRLGACVAAAGNITIYADVAPAAETAVNFTVTN
jgi:hypothetical protein